MPLLLTVSLNLHPPLAHRQMRAFVTGYNTVAEQTDGTPCLAASGANICGRRDAVACPSSIALGTIVEIRGGIYVCEDRLGRRLARNFDISCDKDRSCPGAVTGWAIVKIYD
jgi:3D (Asp-Asp-Asp) domain-containing protein